MKISKKKVYIEFLRIIACFLVIFNHTAEYGFELFLHYPVGTVRYELYCLMSIFCKVSVPIFLMISGVLFIGRKSSMKKYAYNVFRLIFIVLVFSAISFKYYNSSQITINVLVNSFTNDIYNPTYWYLFLYLSFLLLLPILSKFDVFINEKQTILYGYVLVLIFNCFLPIFQAFLLDGWTINKNINPSWLFSMSFFYPLLGYYVDKIEINRKIILTTIVGFTVGILISLWCVNINSIPDNNQYYLSIMMPIICPCVFIIVKALFYNMDNKQSIIKIVICWIGSSTFGVYLLHKLYLDYLWRYFWRQWERYPLLFILFVCFQVFVTLSFVITIYNILKEVVIYLYKEKVIN